MEKRKLIKLRNSFVKAKLRKGSLQWKPRNNAVKNARKQRGKYQCAGCSDLFRREQLHLDHIEPVVGIYGNPKQNNGEYNWNEYVPRLLCDENNFQLLCEVCHNTKTVVENDIRTLNKKKRK